MTQDETVPDTRGSSLLPPGGHPHHSLTSFVHSPESLRGSPTGVALIRSLHRPLGLSHDSDPPGGAASCLPHHSFTSFIRSPLSACRHSFVLTAPQPLVPAGLWTPPASSTRGITQQSIVRLGGCDVSEERVSLGEAHGGIESSMPPHGHSNAVRG